MKNSIQPQRRGNLAILILAISAILLSSLTACGNTIPSHLFTATLPARSTGQRTEENLKTPTTTPTITKTPTLTKTPIKTKKYQWTSTPKPSATITPTKAPFTTYYDKEFGIHISYPNNWVKTADRTFIGEDGYLVLSKLEGYHSSDWCHVAIDVANTLYSQYHPRLFWVKGRKYGCAISMNGLDPSGIMIDKVVGVFPYHVTRDSAYFFTIETTSFHFPDISESITWDENLILPTPTNSPAGTPNPIKTEYPEGIGIEELIYDSPKFNEERPSINFKDNNCGLGFGPEFRTFRYKDQGYGRIIIISRDDQTVFEFASLSSYNLSSLKFCSLGDIWMLETGGYTIINGEILNHALGFDEVFGWHLLSGKPAFFVKRDNEYMISYDDKLLPVKYDDIFHHHCCCDCSFFIPVSNGKTTWFWAERDGVMYLVMLRTK